MNQRGFSFLGMMLMVTALGVAGSLVVVTMTSTFSNQRLNETVKKMDRLVVAIAKFKADSAALSNPPTLAHLFSDVSATGCAPSTPSSKIQGWCGPYLEPVFVQSPNDDITDGWGTVFEYDVTGNLYSWGPNKTDNAGGSDDLTRTF